MTTSEKVANILGMTEAKTLLAAYEDGGRAQDIARNTVASFDGEGRRSLALIEISHVIERIEGQQTAANGKLGRLQKEHDARMMGEGRPCIFVQQAQARFWKYLVVVFVSPFLLWLLMEVVMWRVKKG